MFDTNYPRRVSRSICAIALIAAGCVCSGVAAVQASESIGNNPDHGEKAQGFRVDSWRSWFFVSFLPEGTEAETLGLETESYFPLGSYEVKNIS